MNNAFTLSETIQAEPTEIYEAWLSSEGHTSMTGSPAQVDGNVGGKFSAWDGYIFGTTLELTPNQRILQAWRTSEFPEDALDSHVEVLLEKFDGETRITLIHTDVPENQVDSYRQGWEDFYFKPMKKHFK
ncbi:MAG TPA: SRPBCC family protein [Anaerolineales bacterium]|nr:SRPBCC family protein [Anaerolineales bacterium]